jgi:hypothetical protein
LGTTVESREGEETRVVHVDRVSVPVRTIERGVLFVIKLARDGGEVGWIEVGALEEVVQCMLSTHHRVSFLTEEEKGREREEPMTFESEPTGRMTHDVEVESKAYRSWKIRGTRSMVAKSFGRMR